MSFRGLALTFRALRPLPDPGKPREVLEMIDTDNVSAEWSFAAEPGAARAARHRVRAQLGEWGLGGLSDTAELLVSELVTNSLRYACAPIGVRLTCGPDGGSALLVEVSDPLADPPRERRASPKDEHGRGLQLVARSARRWGVRRLGPGSGKTVWFELAGPGGGAR